jgi:diguanylate cyclase (GGDEF)-like protein/PAS domain S-box-containing protein
MYGVSRTKRVVFYAFALLLAVVPIIVLIEFQHVATDVPRPVTFVLLALFPIAAFVIFYFAASMPAAQEQERRSSQEVTAVAPVSEPVAAILDDSDVPVPAAEIASEPGHVSLLLGSHLLQLCDDSPHIYCVVDFYGRIVEANKAAKDLYSSAGRERGGISWYDMVHPDDQHRTAMAITSLLSSDTRISSFRNRVRCNTGYRWMEWMALSKVDVGMIYTVGQDITEFQNAYIELSDSELRFRVAFDTMHEGMVLVDRAGLLTLINKSAQEMLSISEVDARGKRIFAAEILMLREDGSRLLPEDHPLTEALKTGFSQPDMTIGFHRKDGELRWIEANAVPLFHQGESTPYAAVSTLNDVTEHRQINDQIQSYLVTLEFQKDQLELTNARLEEANDQLQMLATTDALTGLRNHRAFQERLSEELMRAERYKTPLSLILLDVDQFKAYNDSFGHPAGDDVLRRIADVLRDHARTHDLAARYGGEEFILLAPHTDIVGAEILAERCRHAIETVPWGVRQVTSSFGVASLGYGIETGTELIACADHALYAAKAAGRNRVNTYVPSLSKSILKQ